MAINLSHEAADDLAQNFPELNYSRSRNCVWGTLKIECSYNLEKQQILYSTEGESFIEDSYEIRILLNEKDTFGFPKVYEYSERIVSRLKNGEIDDNLRHVETEDGSCCLGIFPEYRWTNICDYIFEKVIPFFYWYSFLELHGSPPWKGYAHGNQGIRQAMTMQGHKVNKASSRNRICPCGSTKKYKKCCIFRDTLLLNKTQK